MSQPEPFFSRPNIHNALWSLLLGLVCFGAGTVWSTYKGKEKVVIATTDDGAKPIVVRVEKAPDDPSILTVARMDALIGEVRRLREQTDPTRKHEAPSSLSNRFNASARSPESSGPSPPPPSTALGDVSPSTDSYALNRPFLPVFELPAAVKGYTQASLAGFGQAACPARVIKTGDSAVIRLVLNPSTNVDELTPVFLSISRPTAKNQVTEVLARQFTLNVGVNQFQVPFDLPAGIYVVDLGFYSRSELDRAYPRLYGIFCEVKVE